MLDKKKLKPRSHGFKGKYCTLCNSVWEMETSVGRVGLLIKHTDFPSYGLERQDCPPCLKVSPETTPDTLEEKIAIERQKIFMKNVSK